MATTQSGPTQSDRGEKGALPALDPLAQCFWTHPAISTVPAGQPLTFEVVIPPTSADGVTFPLVGSAITWSILDVTNSTNVLPLPSSDYQILEGSLDGAVLSLALKPVSGRQVSICPTLTLFYAALPAGSTSQFTPAQYGLAAPDQSDLTNIIQELLTLSATRTLLGPCEAAALQVTPKTTGTVAAVATEVLQEVPSLNLRGALSLNSPLQAIFDAISSVIGESLPGSDWLIDLAKATVSDLADAPMSIPLGLDTLGNRVTTKLTPVNLSPLPTFTSTAQSGQDTSTIEGLLPIGSWTSSLKVVDATWSIKFNGQDSAGDWHDLSPNLKFIKSILIRPDVASLKPGNLPAPKPVTVTVTLTVSVDGTQVAVTPPAVTLYCLPLPLPRVAIAFRKAFNDFSTNQEQLIMVIPDQATAPLMPAVADFLNLFGSLRVALNSFVAIAGSVGINWPELTWLDTAIGAIVDQATATKTSNISVIPAPPVGQVLNLSKTQFDNSVYAVAYIGVREPWFRLRDTDGSDMIDLLNPHKVDTTDKYSAVLPDFRAGWNLAPQIPPKTGWTNNANHIAPWKLEGFSFVTE